MSRNPPQQGPRAPSRCTRPRTAGRSLTASSSDSEQVQGASLTSWTERWLAGLMLFVPGCHPVVSALCESPASGVGCADGESHHHPHGRADGQSSSRNPSRHLRISGTGHVEKRGAVKPRERETSPTQIFAPPSPDRSFELGVFPTSDAARSILTPSGPAEPPRARARVLPVLPLGDRPESTSCALVVLPQAQFKSIP